MEDQRSINTDFGQTSFLLVCCSIFLYFFSEIFQTIRYTTHINNLIRLALLIQVANQRIQMIRNISFLISHSEFRLISLLFGFKYGMCGFLSILWLIIVILQDTSLLDQFRVISYFLDSSNFVFEIGVEKDKHIELCMIIYRQLTDTQYNLRQQNYICILVVRASILCACWSAAKTQQHNICKCEAVQGQKV